MTPTFDELAIISIYRKKTRKATIDEIKEMMTHLEEDETDLKAISESAVRKLENISDDEFEPDEFYEAFGILE